MVFRQKLQASRYELKYTINEGQARTIREFLLSHMVRDEFMLPGKQSYHVKSLYLDTPSLNLCQQTEHGVKNRFKLRVRSYDDMSESPVFFEIKRRDNNVILKHRATVKRSEAQRILQGGHPLDSDLIDPTASQLRSLHRFCQLRASIGAEGVAFVSYDREAYVSPNSNHLRVTFDRNISGQNYHAKDGLTSTDEIKSTAMRSVVLEVKYTEYFPAWIRDLVWTLGLQKVSVPKYLLCVDALQMNRSRFHLRKLGMVS